MIYRTTWNVLQMINAGRRCSIPVQIQLICMHAIVKYVAGVKWLS